MLNECVYGGQFMACLMMKFGLRKLVASIIVIALTQAVIPNMVEYLAEITAYLNERGRWIDRYAWYTTSDPSYTETGLLNDNSVNAELSNMGEYYVQIQPSAHEPGFPNYLFLPLVMTQNLPTNLEIDTTRVPNAYPVPIPPTEPRRQAYP